MADGDTGRACDGHAMPIECEKEYALASVDHREHVEVIGSGGGAPEWSGHGEGSAAVFLAGVEEEGFGRGFGGGRGCLDGCQGRARRRRVRWCSQFGLKGWRTALDGGGGQRRTMAAAAGEGKGTVDEDVGGKGKASTCSGSLVARAAQVEHGGATAAGCRPLFQLAELL
jgi:hypothetical protein